MVGISQAVEQRLDRLKLELVIQLDWASSFIIDPPEDFFDKCRRCQLAVENVVADARFGVHIGIVTGSPNYFLGGFYQLNGF